jgi:hypothetical protein
MIQKWKRRERGGATEVLEKIERDKTRRENKFGELELDLKWCKLECLSQSIKIKMIQKWKRGWGGVDEVNKR